MADPAQSLSKPTTLAFAMGALSESVKGLGDEQTRHREAIEKLPEKLAIHFAPRFEAVEGKVRDLDKRVIVLEGDKGFIRGAFWVIASALVVVGGRAFIFR